MELITLNNANLKRKYKTHNYYGMYRKMKQYKSLAERLSSMLYAARQELSSDENDISCGGCCASDICPYNTWDDTSHSWGEEDNSPTYCTYYIAKSMQLPIASDFKERAGILDEADESPQ